MSPQNLTCKNGKTIQDVLCVLIMYIGIYVHRYIGNFANHVPAANIWPLR